MKFPMSLIIAFIGCCLLYVCVHGTDATTPSGVIQQLIQAFHGQKGGGGSGPPDTGDSTGREESTTTAATSNRLGGTTSTADDDDNGDEL